MQDNEIIELFFDRDEKALSETGAKYGGRLLGIAKNMLGSKEDAEECVNDTYLAAWNNIPPERPVSLFAYISKIVRNAALTKLRDSTAQKRGRAVTVCIDELADVLPDNENVFDNIAVYELSDLINSFLRSCNQDERDIFILRYYGCTPVSDIAKKYGFTQSRIKMTLKRCRDKLAQYLERNGYSI
ncbi:MAG: sigma-70 family RNA polymerase sigma factor [Clostridia bacterium]|nr:sigma-70 family RNA polymerase sigma factor [Clostridia bacterium]